MVSKDSYILPRNPSEAERLHAQHNHLTRSFAGLLVHPSIELDQQRTILDCCTGTGAWLDEARQEAHPDATFDACDLSMEQRSTITPGTDVFTQDIREPFPEDRKGKYDLVHQRFLTAGIRAVDWPRAVKNVADTLKPGGKLNITELNMELARGSGIAKLSEHLEWKNDITRSWWKKAGLIHQCADAMPDLLRQAGLVDVRAVRMRIPYGAACLLLGMPEAQVESTIRLYGGVSPALKHTWVSSGMGTPEEYDAKQLVHEEFLRTEGMWMDCSMVVGTKPSV